MAWSAITAATQLTAVTNSEQFFTTFITLMPGESAEVHVEGTENGSPVDDLQINLYGTLDDATENWDDGPFQSYIIPASATAYKISFLVYGRYKIRVGAIALSGSDSWTVDMEFRKDGVSV